MNLNLNKKSFVRVLMIVQKDGKQMILKLNIEMLPLLVSAVINNIHALRMRNQLDENKECKSTRTCQILYFGGKL